MSRSSSKRLASKISNQLQSVLQSRVMSVGYFISSIVSLFSGNSFLALMFFASCIYANPVAIWKAQNQSREFFQRYKLNVVMLTGIMLGLLLSGAENFSILNHLCSNELISQKEKALTLENSTCFSNFSRFLRDAQAGRILHQGIGTSLGSFKAL